MEHINLLVLAGGFGMRLRAAVSAVPKTLAPVVDRPFLQYQIENWVKQGVTGFTFLLHHQAASIEAFLASLRSEGWLNGCELRTLAEPRPLGTGGAIANAVQQMHFTDSFLVTNADTWLGSGIGRISETEAPSIATVSVEDSERYGALRLDQDRRVVAFEEKQGNAGPGWINAGLYHLHVRSFQDWNGQPFSLERELLPNLVKAGELKAVPLQAEFIDIGVPADYFRFCRWIESGKADPL
jgi:NDP-sugar pyrophosphorylase family protein